MRVNFDPYQCVNTLNSLEELRGFIPRGQVHPYLGKTLLPRSQCKKLASMWAISRKKALRAMLSGCRSRFYETVLPKFADKI
jgi:hypothetical protein